MLLHVVADKDAFSVCAILPRGLLARAGQALHYCVGGSANKVVGYVSALATLLAVKASCSCSTR